ncbi:isocitrate lyase/phosphoenolpyruvate mutase family protein [Phenylobacterium sp.]|uniref:isocitrate lyase/PEP mutase family protein n=1 Tax=Phenylobacterium sp. TaxID=1871053 RepID=UPI0026006E17|nr:isocitrate lyase/phosphoenolpyruvate mutase family protein [Phenylobacterium sp.]
MRRSAVVRARIEQRSGLIIPGCHDPLSARLIEAAGFEAAYLSGLAANAVVGLPDLGNMSLTSMEARTREIASAISLPLFVDADNGFGGVADAAESARRLEAAGAVGVNLDDTVLPRAAGAPKTLEPIHLVQDKVAAARGACADADFLVIGRTDAMSTHGPDEALRRARALEDAGADALMVPYLTEARQVRMFAAALRVPLFIAVTETARESFSAEELAGAGHAATVYPVTVLLAGLGAQARALAHLAQAGDTQAIEAKMMPIGELRALTKPI